MFASRRIPLKDGRREPVVQALRSWKHRRCQLQRALLATLMILFCCGCLSSLAWPTISDKSAPLEHNATSTRVSHEAPCVQKSVQNGTCTVKASPDIDAAWQAVVSLLPDELERHYLLQEMAKLSGSHDTSTLHQLGLLVRKYKVLFEAWEDLHLVNNINGGISIQNDIIPYLYQRVGSTDAKSTENVSITSQVQSYDAYRKFLADFGQALFPWTLPYHQDHMSLHSSMKQRGVGIVLTAGNGQALFVLTAIPVFRTLGCTLPIELMYFGDSDLDKDYRVKLEAIEGVVTRDLSSMVSVIGWTLRGWAAKPFAILFSSFREVLFIDADSLFFKDPALLFEDPLYRSTGALFFRDRLILPGSKREFLLQLLPKPISQQVKNSRLWTGDSIHMQESGVMLIDKWRHFIALLLVAHLNGPLSPVVYDLVYGDKETYWLGWELAGDLQYAFHPGDTGTMGILQQPLPHNDDDISGVTNTDTGMQHESAKICAPQLLHLDLEGRPLWFNGWLAENKMKSMEQRHFGHFDYYLAESQNPHDWDMQKDNICCLSRDPDSLQRFSTNERQALDMMIAIASRNSGL